MAAALPACAGRTRASSVTAVQCEVRDTVLVRDVIYFGRNRPDGGTVSGAEWQEFLDQVVTPRFPMGLTVVEAMGQCFGATAVVHPAAAQRGTPEQAKLLLEKGAEVLQLGGTQGALGAFNAGKGQFVDRDLYVFCIGPDRKISANGGFPSLVGSSVDRLKDADGKPLGTALLEAAAKKEGSVHYRWVNPVSHKTEPKTSYVRKVGADACGVGVYAPEDPKE